MNSDQTEIYNRVVNSVNNQLNGSTERLRWFVTGGAGVGKTFLFILLRNLINRCYGKRVVNVGALTGVAARLINGITLHAMLNQMRLLWRDIEYLFIEYLSEMLCMIDSRLKQLKNNNEPFGGINVLVFGDLMQLPPVRGNQVFSQPDNLQPAINSWRLYTVVQMKKNMRQQGDSTFIDILNALRSELPDQN